MRRFAPPEISAHTLRKLKEAAESYLGHKVNRALITVPAYFNDAQRGPPKMRAGASQVERINEPTAVRAAGPAEEKKSWSSDLAAERSTFRCSKWG